MSDYWKFHTECVLRILLPPTFARILLDNGMVTFPKTRVGADFVHRYAHWVSDVLPSLFLTDSEHPLGVRIELVCS